MGEVFKELFFVQYQKKHWREKPMNIIANQDKIGTSKFDLLLFKLFYLLSFKKSKWLAVKIEEIKKDLETIKKRKVF